MSTALALRPETEQERLTKMYRRKGVLPYYSKVKAYERELLVECHAMGNIYYRFDDDGMVMGVEVEAEP